MLRRHAGACLDAALADRPVVLVVGPRQAGKTTLVRAAVEARPGFAYATLDEPAVFAAASSDPDGFLAGFDGPVAIDEVQRAPDLLRAVKLRVDSDRRPGRFLLTGSANVLVLPKVSESLAGRMEVLRLPPFSQAEIEGVDGGFLGRLVDGGGPLVAGWRAPRDRRGLHERIVRGGFPEASAIADEDRRAAWFRSFETTIVHRDVRDVAHIEDTAAIPRLLRVLAARTARPANLADVGRDARLAAMTLRRYVGHLEALYLVSETPAWATNLPKRYAKAPKLFVTDTGFALHLLQASAARLASDPVMLGALVETFVLTEIDKLRAAGGDAVSAFHYRTHGGAEVDLVLEDRDGRVVGVEVKSAAAIRADAFDGLRALEADAGKRFHRGVVLHAGRETVPFSRRLAAVPIDALWAD